MDMLTNLMVQYAGPFAKFVVAKTIKDMGYDVETFPYDKIRELIITSVERAIFDPVKREQAKKEILKEFGLY